MKDHRDPAIVMIEGIAVALSLAVGMVIGAFFVGRYNHTPAWMAAFAGAFFVARTLWLVGAYQWEQRRIDERAATWLAAQREHLRTWWRLKRDGIL